ncbi:serine/threonine-protein kinase [Streptomyces sp. SL13]|uniref:non-specific serine/threonine protein kinase n=1 Tax=Streptantibioticus silvisoli TaxID=2705255 RepID=A0AA90H7N4_9ACTN|nr:serine/threonine-protein kinase [Streptantibioticus silvisoli]MDI5972034.1 serine/threonine-protein kinase [Streptantibioticus silvisoli]
MMLGERYRLDMPLGRGGMGEVWMAVDERLNRPVAVKLLTESAMGDDRSAARFRREARTAARLNHPRIVTVYDFGVSDGRCFLAMELVNGSSLAHELRRRGPLGPSRVAALAAQTAEGLAEAHRLGVVHRDVKPSNLLLDEDGMVKVADFGVARCPGAETTTYTTGTGLITGTSLYLAPEAALGGTAGAAADVYALGCALYELLTGKPPFTGEHPVAVLCQHVETVPVSPCSRCPDLPDAFGDIVLSMLAKRPEDRPDALEVAAWFGEVAAAGWTGSASGRTGATGGRTSAAAGREGAAAGRTAAAAAQPVTGERSAPGRKGAVGRPAAPVARTVGTPGAAGAEAAPARRGPVVVGAVATAAVLVAAVAVLTAPRTDGTPHSTAPGTGPRSAASAPAAEPGTGPRGRGEDAGAGGRTSTSPRSVPKGSLSSPTAADATAGRPGTATRPSHDPTTAPAKTPPPATGTPSPSSSASTGPSTPPSSTSPSPSTTASTPTATAGAAADRGGRKV